MPGQTSSGGAKRPAGAQVAAKSQLGHSDAGAGGLPVALRMVLAMLGFLLELLPCDLLAYFEHGDISSFAAELMLIFIKEPWAVELFVEKLGNSAAAPSHGRIRTAFAAAIRSVRGKSSAELTERARAERSVLVRQRGLCWLSLVHCATRCFCVKMRSCMCVCVFVLVWIFRCHV